jgi:hypothetical protein
MSIDARTLTAVVKKYPIPVISAIIAVVLVVVLYLRSDLSVIQQAQLDKFTAEGKLYRTNVSNSAQLEEQIDFMVQANAAVRARALNASGLAENLQYFYRLESEVGIKYRDLRPAGKGKGSTYVPLSYIVSFEGTFTQVITYLKHLEQGAYFCRITGASLSGGADKVTINLNLDVLGLP